MIQVLETLLEGDVQLAILDGPPGRGKTTLMAQFALAHPRSSVCLFIGASSRYAYDPSILLFDTCNQLNSILYGQELEPATDCDDSLLRHLISTAARKWRGQPSPIYFVVDGLCDIPAEHAAVRDLVLTWLPFGFPIFRTIASGNCLEGIPGLSRVSKKTFHLPAFSFRECEELLRTIIPSDEIRGAYTTTRGHPEFVAAYIRTSRSGSRPTALGSDSPDTLTSRFDLEWQAIDSELLHRALAIVAFSEVTHPLADLARFLQVTGDRLSSELSKCGFIRTHPHDNTISFVSDAFRRYAQTKLAGRQQEASALLVDALLQAPDSQEALALVPVYLSKAPRSDDLLTYLTTERLALMLERGHLRAPAEQSTALGIETALSHAKDTELFRLGIASSAIRQYSSYAAAKAELEACVALDDYQAATAIAHSATLKLDRLRLLAAVSRAQRQSGLAIPEEILEEIGDLSTSTDLGSGQEASELAADLFFSKPEAAIQLLEVARNSPENDPHSLDWTFAKMSIEAAVAGQQDTDAFRALQGQIRDPEANRLATASSFLFRDYTSGELLAEVDRLANYKDQLWLLRQWAQGARRSMDVASVLRRALNICIRATDYTPNATHLRELASALPAIKDATAAKELVTTFDGIAGKARDLGPSTDFTRLQLSLAIAERSYDSSACNNRLVETHLYVSSCENVLTRAISLAHFLAGLALADPNNELEQSTQVRTKTKEAFDLDLQSLLKASADHLEATHNIISALATNSLSEAFRIASLLNTRSRRDQARHDAIRQHLEQPLRKLRLDLILAHLDAFEDRDYVDETIEDVISRVGATRSDTSLAQVLARIAPFAHRALQISDLGTRALTTARAYILFKRAATATGAETAAEKGAELSAKLLAAVHGAWSGLNASPIKAELGFQLVTLLAKHDRHAAIQQLAECRALARTVPSREASTTLGFVTRLLLRCYHALLTAKADATNDHKLVLSRIANAQAPSQQVSLMASLAFALQKHNRTDLAANVVDALRTLLTDLKNRDIAEWRRSMTFAAPALYRAHHETALESIRQLPWWWRDRCLSEIVKVLIFKTDPSEPVDESSPQVGRVRYDEAIDVCNLLNEFCCDGPLYLSVTRLCDAIADKANKNALSGEQRQAISQRLEATIQSQFPRPGFVSHDGFAIAALAALYRCSRRRDDGDWTRLIERARMIPNSADVAFVLTTIAEHIPESTRRSKLLQEAASISATIPWVGDRADRLCSIARTARNGDLVIARRSIGDALRLMDGEDSDDVAWRNVVDLAYSIDPQMAEEFVSALDKDAARISARQAKDELTLLRLKTKMTERSSNVDEICSDKLLPKASWRMLASLNANRVGPLPAKQCRPFVKAASKLPIGQAYPTFAWAVENLARRHSDGHEGQTLLRGLFGSMLLGCDLAERLWRMTSQQPTSGALLASGAEPQPSIVVRAGERGVALKYIREFIQSTAGGFVKIADPYLGPDEIVEILRLLRDCGIDSEVQIITSWRHFVKEQIPSPWDDQIRQTWRRASDQRPLPTRVVVASLGASADSPVHDRWWFTDHGGIRLGTSFNSLGDRRDSEIARLTSNERQERLAMFDEYMAGRRPMQGGEHITYLTCTL